MELSIKSDGTLQGTYLHDENGEKIQGVSKIVWGVAGGERAKADITFVGMKIDVVGDFVTNPEFEEEYQRRKKIKDGDSS